MSESFLNGKIELHCGDMAAVLPRLAENSIDSCVCDPPYHLTSIVKRFGSEKAAPAKAGKTGAYARASAGFMGKQWDGGDVAFRVETWAEVYRVLKPGAHLIAFSGTRTYHRMACAIEDAGFEIRDMKAWLYGSGFPKSHDVSKAIDRALGCERSKIRIPASQLKNPPNLVGGAIKGDDRPWRESAMERGFHEAVSDEAVSDEAVSWAGWGTALKPALEPIVLARKPLSEKTVATNVLKWGTGALNIDACRIETSEQWEGRDLPNAEDGVCWGGTLNASSSSSSHPLGRWPANLLHDGSEEVVGAFPDAPGQQRYTGPEYGKKDSVNCYGDYAEVSAHEPRGDSGSAARFFYSSKADADDRLGSKHPTVKPLDLMQYLVRLVTPPRGVVLDCFAGTGTTGEAACREGFNAVLIERESEYQDDIRRRMKLCLAGPDERAREAIKAKLKDKPQDHGPLFGGSEMSRGGAGRYTATSPTKTNDWANRNDEVVNS